MEDGGPAAPQQPATVIPSAGEESLIGDLLSLDLPSTSYNAPPPVAGGETVGDCTMHTLIGKCVEALTFGSCVCVMFFRWFG